MELAWFAASWHLVKFQGLGMGGILVAVELEGGHQQAGCRIPLFGEWAEETHRSFHLPDHINSEFSESRYDLCFCLCGLILRMTTYLLAQKQQQLVPGEEPFILLPVTL